MQIYRILEAKLENANGPGIFYFEITNKHWISALAEHNIESRITNKHWITRLTEHSFGEAYRIVDWLVSPVH